MPGLSRGQVNELLKMVDNVRDQAIITMFAESGLRLTKLVNVSPTDIDWENHTIRVLGKRRERSPGFPGNINV